MKKDAVTMYSMKYRLLLDLKKKKKGGGGEV